MARGRMIDKCISISEKINDLTVKEAFIYTWIIPHLDDWGRTSGSPRTLKALVFPMKREISINCIELALIKFKQIGLFWWETIGSIQVLQQPPEEFNSHQSISENKRSKSTLPEIPRNPQEMPEIPSLIKVNLSEVNLTQSKENLEEGSIEPVDNLPISKGKQKYNYYNGMEAERKHNKTKEIKSIDTDTGFSSFKDIVNKIITTKGMK
jgi:hypothetical protein